MNSSLTSDLAEPVYFGQPACFGWLHGRGAAGLPVLICGPVGVEDLSAHRMLRLAAEALARGGQPCLRFDLLGQGDSAPLGAEADALPAWLASVHAAADALRKATGAPRIALLGLRLGASLAALAASTRDDIEALCAWAPVASGRTMLREWKLLGAQDVPSVSHADGSLESGGFRYNAATCAALRQLSLTAPLVRPAPRLLVLDRDDFPSAQPWCAALAGSGAVVECERLPGFDGFLAEPHLAVVPEAWLQRGVAWLRALSMDGDGQPRYRPTPTPTPTPFAAEVVLPIDGRLVREQPLFLPGGSPDEPALFALRSERASATAAQAQALTAVLVLNTGAERRIGPHGQFVALTRRWAGAGALTLRLDLAGLGDSQALAAASGVQQAYPPRAMADIGRALAYLRRQPGVRRVVVLGLCSGAFHAFEAAAQALPFDLAVAINPLLFFRPRQVDFAELARQDHAVQQLCGDAVRNLADRGRWIKLLRGEVNLGFIAATLGRRLLLAARRQARNASRSVGCPWHDDVAAKLQRAAPPQATPRLCFVFSEHEAGMAVLRAEAGTAMQLLQRQGRLQVQVVPGADHTFGRAESQQQLAQVLDAVLGLQQPSAQAGGDIASQAGPAAQAAQAAPAAQAETRASSMRRARCASASSI